MIIGISGKIGSGKDTAAELLQELYPEANFEIKKFAGKLKQVASMLTGIAIEKFEDQEFKKTHLGPEWSSFIYIGEFKDQLVENRMTVRELLQKLGTEAMREGLHQNVWVNSLFADYLAKTIATGTSEFDVTEKDVLPNWIITDVRFANEAIAVKKRGILIRIERDNLSFTSNHSSETSLDNYSDFDYVIKNNGSIEDLRAELSKLKLFI